MATPYHAPANVDVLLQESAQKFRKELIKMPMLALALSLAHMTRRPGIRGKETVGELSGDMQFGPYSESRKGKSNVKVTARTLETFLGSVEEDFSPNSVWSTVYGINETMGDALKNSPMALQVLSFVAAKLGNNLHKVLWSATRNAEGTKSIDLFNGFDTITKTEISGEAITDVIGNKVVIEKITKANAVDILKSVYRKATDELKEQHTKLFMPTAVYDAYVDDYQATVGGVPYNREFNKTFLEGSNNMCELVPLANKKASPFLHLTTQSNMLVGYDGTGESEKVEINKFASFVLTYAATTCFGVQFESISPERLLVATIDATQPIV